jgi:hypothetical protein
MSPGRDIDSLELRVAFANVGESTVVDVQVSLCRGVRLLAPL